MLLDAIQQERINERTRESREEGGEKRDLIICSYNLNFALSDEHDIVSFLLYVIRYPFLFFFLTKSYVLCYLPKQILFSFKKLIMSGRIVSLC